VVVIPPQAVAARVARRRVEAIPQEAAAAQRRRVEVVPREAVAARVARRRFSRRRRGISVWPIRGVLELCPPLVR
jgi:hypothetical protein